VLRADDVTFGYGGTPVLHGVSLEIPRGTCVGLIGPNGSGKTTLLRLLSGTRRPTSGRVLLDGQPIEARSRAEIARRMAVVPQQSQVAFDYSALEVVVMGRYPHLGAFEVEGPRDIDAARRALAATGSAGLEPRLFATLSGGEQQRVIIAAALAQIDAADAVDSQTPVLLLDEPTAALDLKHQLAVASLLETLHRQRGITVVVSTHDLSLAAAICERLILLKDGRVLSAGSTEAVLTSAEIRRLYEVDVDILRLPGRRTAVVPLARQDA
jgi:iron complex transport system ATP-binding protein